MSRPTTQKSAAKAKSSKIGTPLAEKRKLIVATRDAAKRARRARLSELVVLIRQKLGTVADAFYDVGLALSEIVDEKLYLAERHASFGAFLKAHRFLSRAQASKLIAITKEVPRAQALKLGVEKSYALVGYASATPEADSPSSLLAAKASFGGKTAAKTSKRSIEAATRAIRAKRPPTKAAAERAAETAKLTRLLARALNKTGLTGAAITRTRECFRAEWSLARVEKLARA